MVGEAGDNGRRPDVERSSAITIAADSPDEIVSHGLASRRRNFFVKVTYRPADQRGFRNHQLYLKLFCQRLTCAAWVEWSSFYIVQRIYKQLKLRLDSLSDILNKKNHHQNIDTARRTINT